jgi:hypothetical protein
VVALFAGYFALTRAADSGAEPAAAGNAVERIADVQQRPHLVFRDTRQDGTYGHAVLAPLDAVDTDRIPTSLACERVHVGGTRGVCLQADRGVITTYRAVVFDETFAPRHEIALPGVPSRVRVSPDGSRAGITVFVNGDSYAAGNFSTRTLIVDTADGQVLGNLEDFAITRDGRAFKAVDFNFWGVTFADRSRFYATLATGGHTYLIEGDVDSRHARTLRDGIECPSLSPDRTRVAFKKRIRDGVRLVWRIGVLDLASMQETLVADTRNVDDQAEWLDDQRVVYGLPSATSPGSSDVWAAPADGSGSPSMLVKDAWSPAIVRAGKVAS